MFCPNCGQNCGEARFCSNCGTRLVRPVSENKNTKKGTTDIPTSSGYLGVGGSVVLSESAVSVCVNGLFKKHRTWIPYDQLVTVIYKRPTLKPGSYGALLFRGQANKTVPIPGNGNFGGDQSAVAVSAEMDILFYHLYYMLKAVAPSTARFEMILPPVHIQGLDEMAQMVDMEYFYTMYAPHRERAASGIVAKHALPPEAARALVDRVFDEKQKQMYALDPLDAIRDLNLVVDAMKRQQRADNRMDAERRKWQENERIASSLEALERMKRLEMLDDYLDERGR